VNNICCFVPKFLVGVYIDLVLFFT